MPLRLWLTVFLASVSLAAHADSVDINVSDDSVELAYATNFRSAEFGVSGLLVDNDTADDDGYVALSLLALGELGGRGTRAEAGVGGKLYGVSVGDEEILALGLGGQVRVFPGNGPVAIGAYGFYAPDILTGIDGKRFWEAGARLEFEVVQRTASVYVGYRKVRATLDNDVSGNVDRGGFAGLRISF